MKKATVTVISLGGTISCTPATAGDGVVPTLGAADLVLSLEGTAPEVDIQPLTWSTRDSSEITFAELVDLAAEVRKQFEAGAQGVVLTQGTDTIDESAFALDLLLGLEHPIVITGALHNPSQSKSDGPANLQAALQVAVSPELREVGTVVVMNDEIHAAQWVRKSHTSNSAAFQSPGVGPIGWIAESRPVFAVKPFHARKAPIDGATGAGNVALITAVMDDTPMIVDSILSLGYKGLVVDGMGGGHVSGGFSEALARAAQSIPVVFASRTGSGSVLQSTYSSPGAEVDLINHGLIPAGSLPGLKARILLTLLIRNGATDTEIADTFAAYGRYLSRPAHHLNPESNYA
ncbi:asparaginase [Pseudarthrobacter sp. TAF60_1]|uniref:asparaginase n=1 Tax=Pseudarthrobacter sp. TAF60_1 TaxID=3233071 RepID=UPI003F965B64